MSKRRVQQSPAQQRSIHAPPTPIVLLAVLRPAAGSSCSCSRARWSGPAACGCGWCRRSTPSSSARCARQGWAGRHCPLPHLVACPLACSPRPPAMRPAHLLPACSPCRQPLAPPLSNPPLLPCPAGRWGRPAIPQVIVASKFDNRLKEFGERWEVDRYLSATGYLPPGVKPFFVALPKARPGRCAHPCPPHAPPCPKAHPAPKHASGP